MGAAYTLYKFRKLFILVLIGLILLSVKSQINPLVGDAKKEAVSSIDATGMATQVLEIEENIPDPEGTIKQESGNFLFNLMEEHPDTFVLLAVLIALILFVGGVYLKDVRGVLRRI